MNQDNNYFNQHGNNQTFNNQNQQNGKNINNEYYNNQHINQNNNSNQPHFDNNLENNRVYQQPINQNNTYYNKETNNQKQNKFKIIGFIAVIFVVLVVGIILFSNNNAVGTKSGTTVNQGKELKIKSDYVDINLTVEAVERNVKVSNLLGEEEFFTKIKISIVNNDKKDSFNSGFIAYELFDQNQNLLKDSTCLDESWNPTYNLIDAIKVEIPANSTDSGYLYCKDNGNMGKILGITSFTAFDEDLIQQGHIKSTDSDVFYVSLK